ncbi:hypothetical protein L1987_12097 [Smallanthus sonchifolius]|uniref:Uncharacterized protein n=1 Tax=Smallanthus sonchifolius TaxID=185202 RepID=A0ACB9JEC8_9ASTR|nr:hypothetical protein L1987_12097 [Smallanthus sonchifolius]
MEIAELNLIGDFEAGMKCLQNPSLISKLSSIDKFPQLYISCQNSYPQHIFDDDDFDFDFSDEGGDDDTPSSVAESDDEELDSEDGRVDEVFRVEGSSLRREGGFGLRRRNGFSLSDFSAGKSVVQLWDSFGLGLDFEDDGLDYGGEIAIWDLDRDVKISSGRRCQVAAATVAENVVVTAEMNGSNGGVGFGTYDSRVDGTSPAIYAAWRPRQRNV